MQLTPLTRNPPQLSLTEVEQQRRVWDLTPTNGLSLRARAVRGLDCVAFILRRFGYEFDRYVGQSYGEEFIDMNGRGQSISAKLLEPRQVAHVESVLIGERCVGFPVFLSEHVNTPYVVYFLHPIKNGSPAVLPIRHSATVEKDVVRGFLFCLQQIGFRFSAGALPWHQNSLEFLKEKLADGDFLTGYMHTHLLTQNASK